MMFMIDWIDFMGDSEEGAMPLFSARRGVVMTVQVGDGHIVERHFLLDVSILAWRQ